MVRSYDARRRKQNAVQTRNAIIQAAMKLHWEGISEFEFIAEEAGCSVATVRKHFPTKESLYRDCTRTFAASLAFPDLAAMAKIRSRTERLNQGVREMCRLHDAMFGYAWHSAYARRNSPALGTVMDEYEGMAEAISQIIVPKRSDRLATVRGLLDFLTYRALRLSGNISQENLANELVAIISLVLGEQK
ncbi:MAG: AcrR family transcriptional regulator [Gammaproteobacteria bacterium]|jgi:AcrR family transcriptional regulator